MVDLAKLRSRMVKCYASPPPFAPGCNAHLGRRALYDGGLELFDFAPDLFLALAKPLL